MRAGVFFPHESLLQSEEPVGQEAHRHVVAPAHPGADLVMVHPEVVLGDLEALFDGVAAAGDAGERLPGGGRIGVGEVVADLGILIERTDDDQELSGADLLFVLGADPGGDHVHFKRPLLSIADAHARSGALGLDFAPVGDVDERDLEARPLLTGHGRRGNRLQIAYKRVGGHFQEVRFFAGAKGPSEPGGATELIVARHPAVRDAGRDEVQKLKGDLDLGTEADVFGDMALVHAAPAAGPLVRQIELSVQEREASAPVVTDEDPDLAVIRLSETPAPLTGDPDGMGPLLGEAAAVEGEVSRPVVPF